MAKVLLLRSSEGKVLVAPTWDKRPAGGRQQAEEESACHHRKRQTAVTRPAAAAVARILPVPAAAALLKVTAPAQLHPSKPAASSLRARRGLSELSCKCPKQNLLLAGSRRPPA